MSPVAPGNPDVVTYLAGLYGQQEYSDCKVVFMLEKAPPPGGQVAPSTTSLAPGSVVGAPLPAHSCILRPACDKWNQQWLDWTPRPDSDAHASKRRKLSADQAVTVTITVAGEASPSGAARADVPEICVALRSADEMVAAAAVVKFAYTGLVEAGSITEALQVRRQADYLRMPRCMEACLALVKEGPLLAEGPSAGASASATGGGDGDGGGNSSNAQAAIELLGCGALWPDPANDPTWRAFGALLAEATRQLVAHFGDALAVLNNDDLLNQMRALPVMCLALLLESDDFGTDDESSVVLVLAMWMGVNYSRTSAKARRQLCGMLRLVHCSRAYLDWVLPALALDHHCHPNSGAGWLPIVPSQVGWLSKYVGASGPMKKALWEERRAGGRWRAGGLAQRQAAAPVRATGRPYLHLQRQKAGTTGSIRKPGRAAVRLHLCQSGCPSEREHLGDGVGVVSRPYLHARPGACVRVTRYACAGRIRRQVGHCAPAKPAEPPRGVAPGGRVPVQVGRGRAADRCAYRQLREQ